MNNFKIFNIENSEITELKIFLINNKSYRNEDDKKLAIKNESVFINIKELFDLIHDFGEMIGYNIQKYKEEQKTESKIKKGMTLKQVSEEINKEIVGKLIEYSKKNLDEDDFIEEKELKKLIEKIIPQFKPKDREDLYFNFTEVMEVKSFYTV